MWRSSVQFVHGVGVAAYYNGAGYDTFVYVIVCTIVCVAGRGVRHNSSVARRRGPIGAFDWV